MKYTWIENYAGTWQDDEGRTIVITIQNDQNALVDILLKGTPMPRPWCADKPASGLSSMYFPAEGPDLEVDLGRPGFSLSLSYVSDDQMALKSPEHLAVGISRNENDEEARRHTKLFGKLGIFKRTKA